MGQSCPCGAQTDVEVPKRPPKNTERLLDEASEGRESSEEKPEGNGVEQEQSDDEQGNEEVPLDERSMNFEIHPEDAANKEILFKSWREALLDGNTALLEWYSQEHPEMDLINYEFPDGSSSLSKAIQCKLVGSVHNLISEGADANHLNPQTGNTPLHESVLVENPKLVAYLAKERQVDTTIRNKEGKTAYDLAAQLDNLPIMELLEPEVLPTVIETSKPKSALEELGDFVGEKVEVVNDKSNANATSSASPTTTTQTLDRSDTKPLVATANGESSANQNADGNPEQDVKSTEANKGYYEHIKKNVKPKVVADNPFNRRLKKETTEAVLEQMQTIQQEQEKLPVLEAFLEKKQPRAPYSWQKRWVVVKHGHMMWSDRQRDITDATKAQERNKFNGQVAIMHFVEWGPIETRSNNKFYLVANTDKEKKRKFEFKAVSEQDRDFWIKGIQEHIIHEKKND